MVAKAPPAPPLADDGEVFYPPFAPLPPVIAPPVVVIPPGEPPCHDGDTDPICDDDPEEPPVDMPEPGIVFLIGAGALIWRRFAR